MESINGRYCRSLRERDAVARNVTSRIGTGSRDVFYSAEAFGPRSVAGIDAVAELRKGLQAKRVHAQETAKAALWSTHGLHEQLKRILRSGASRRRDHCAPENLKII
jgi:hypothetical protein